MFFSGKKELSSGVAALRCLVSMTDFTCIHMRHTCICVHFFNSLALVAKQW